MAFDLPQRRINIKQIQTQKRDVPIDKIIAIEGQSPIAQGIETLGNSLGTVLAKRAQARLQGQQIAQLAQLAGESAPTGDSVLDPALYEKGLALKTAADSKKAAAAKQRTDLELSLEKLKSGYSETDATGKSTTYPGVQGLSIKYDEAGNPYVQRDEATYKPKVQPKPSGGGSGGGKGDPLKELQNDLDPANPKSGMKNLYDKTNAADRVVTLIDQSGGNPNVLQSPEVAASVAALVQSGNSSRVAQQQLEHLTPSSLKGDIMKQIAYLGNSPESLGQQEFFHSLRETALREKGVTQKQIKLSQAQRLGRHDQTRILFPGAYSSILANYGLDAAKVQNGRYVDPEMDPNIGASPQLQPIDKKKPMAIPALTGKKKALADKLGL